jgi:hypothetical protein
MEGGLYGLFQKYCLIEHLGGNYVGFADDVARSLKELTGCEDDVLHSIAEEQAQICCNYSERACRLYYEEADTVVEVSPEFDEEPEPDAGAESNIDEDDLIDDPSCDQCRFEIVNRAIIDLTTCCAVGNANSELRNDLCLLLNS